MYYAVIVASSLKCYQKEDPESKKKEGDCSEGSTLCYKHVVKNKISGEHVIEMGCADPSNTRKVAADECINAKEFCERSTKIGKDHVKDMVSKVTLPSVTFPKIPEIPDNSLRQMCALMSRDHDVSTYCHCGTDLCNASCRLRSSNKFMLLAIIPATNLAYQLLMI